MPAISSISSINFSVRTPAADVVYKSTGTGKVAGTPNVTGAVSATVQVSSTPSVAATPNVATTAKATSTAKEILQLKSSCESKIVTGGFPAVYNVLFEKIFVQPIITINKAMEELNVSYPTAAKIIDNFCKYMLVAKIGKRFEQWHYLLNFELVFLIFCNICWFHSAKPGNW